MYNKKEDDILGKGFINLNSTTGPDFSSISSTFWTYMSTIFMINILYDGYKVNNVNIKISHKTNKYYY